jgi:isopenicillin N synthase-like dioxygenase
MSNNFYSEIPSMDLDNYIYGNELQKKMFIDNLGKAFNEIGFVAIKGHGLSSVLIKDLYNLVQQFFSLPDQVKKKYEIPGLYGQRGYTGKGKEHAKGRTVGDLKEFYHIGQEVVGDDPVKTKYPENIWPEELPQFKPVMLEAYRKLEAAGKIILKSIALYLNLEEDYFEEKVKNGNSILRPIHYFPIENPEEVPEDAVRAAEHGDINLITLLMGASAEGLQILRRDNKWIPVTALPEQIVVNVGDMLARLTNNKLKSTIHRVVNPPRENMKSSRFSIPFFMHPRAEMDLTCLDNCIDSLNEKQYSDMTAGEFLNERLAEIGLKK